ITVADGFHAAVEAARANRFELVLSDIELGDGDGCELLGQIRALYPIVGVAFSGHGRPEDVTRCLEAGYSVHVLKPTTIAQLDQIVRNALAQHSGAADRPAPSIAPQFEEKKDQGGSGQRNLPGL
ncbi:MAG TPA: response regulator, partial [Tepidisphaeraceae bacterium]|nr:response regulator [Tepidisphaeraceae bacterium]